MTTKEKPEEKVEEKPEPRVSVSWNGQTEVLPVSEARALIAKLEEDRKAKAETVDSVTRFPTPVQKGTGK